MLREAYVFAWIADAPACPDPIIAALALPPWMAGCATPQYRRPCAWFRLPMPSRPAAGLPEARKIECHADCQTRLQPARCRSIRRWKRGYAEALSYMNSN